MGFHKRGTIVVNPYSTNIPTPLHPTLANNICSITTRPEYAKLVYSNK